MKKNLKQFTLIAATLVLAAGALTGCKKETPPVIIEDTIANAKKVDSYKGTLQMNMTMGISVEGVSMDMDTNLLMDMEATTKPADFHMKGTVGVDFMNINTETEIYGKESKDGKTITTYALANDQWTKTEAEKDDSQTAASFLNLDNFLQKGGKLELQKDTEKENGKDVYVINSSITGDKMDSAENIIGGIAGGTMDQLDLTDLKGDVVIKIYKDTRLPASISIDFMDSLGTGITAGADGAEVSLKGLDFVITFDEFNKVKKIDLPEEALNASESDPSTDDILDGMLEDNSDASAYESEKIETDKDGNYIVTDYSKKKEVLLSPPKGLKVDEYSTPYYASFYTDSVDNGNVYLNFSLEQQSEYYNETVIMESLKEEQTYFTDLEEYSDVLVEEPKTIKVGKKEAKYASISTTYNGSLYDKSWQVWMLTKDGYLLECRISESSYETPTSAVTEEKIIEWMSCFKE